MSDEWRLPVPDEDPETYKAGLVRDDKGGARLVPDGNIVEGELEKDHTKDQPSCPFSSS